MTNKRFKSTNLNLIALLVISAVALIGCQAQSKLPREMPADVRMGYGSNGGMTPYYTDIAVEGETLIFKEKTLEIKGQEVIWTARISPQDQAGLYRLFVENKVDQIKNESQKGIVYDAGSEGVSLSFGSESYNVIYGANFRLSSANQARYGNVVAEFTRLKEKYQSMQERPVETSLEEARAQAATFFAALNKNAAGKTMYSVKFTPYFPTEWGAEQATKWVSYVYASGMEPGLVDGERVSKAFGKIDYNPSTQKAVFEKIAAKLEDDSIQGVKPLPKDSLETLKSGQVVEHILLLTKSKSALSAGDAVKVAAFYELWRKYNGTIFQQFAHNHTDFYLWVDQMGSEKPAD